MAPNDDYQIISGQGDGSREEFFDYIHFYSLHVWHVTWKFAGLEEPEKNPPHLKRNMIWTIQVVLHFRASSDARFSRLWTVLATEATKQLSVSTVENTTNSQPTERSLHLSSHSWRWTWDLHWMMLRTRNGGSNSRIPYVVGLFGLFSYIILISLPYMSALNDAIARGKRVGSREFGIPYPKSMPLWKMNGWNLQPSPA